MHKKVSFVSFGIISEMFLGTAFAITGCHRERGA